jgi:hypothetical protein
MLEKDFTLHPEALELNQLGFDEPCIAWYAENKGLQIAPDTFKKWTSKPCNNSNIITVFNSDCITAPTYSQAFRWFREKHQLIHHVSWVYKKTYDGVDWFFEIKGINMANNNVIPHEETRFETYEEAELGCLKKLIGIVKSSRG